MADRFSTTDINSFSETLPQSSKTPAVTNNTVESVNLDTYIENLDTTQNMTLENVSYTKEELEIIKEEYLDQYQTNIKFFEELLEQAETMLKDAEDKDGILLEIENYLTYSVQPEYDYYKATYTDEEMQEKFGITQKEFSEMSLEEFVNYMKKYDPHLEVYADALDEMTDRLLEGTDLTKKEDFETYKTSLENDIAIINLAIEKTKEAENNIDYNLLELTEEYQTFETTSLELDKNKLYEDGMVQGSTLSYTEYCYRNGDVNPLEFVKATKKMGIDSLTIYGYTGTNYEKVLELSDTYPEFEKKYSYLYETKGKKAADKYLENVENDLNMLMGQKQAQEFLSSLEGHENAEEKLENHLKTTGKGILDGMESWAEGVHSAGEAFASIFGYKASDVYSINEYETMYILQALQEEEYGWLDNNYELSQSAGNLLPSVTLGILLTPGVGTFSVGVSAGGNSYHGGIVEGYSNTQSIVYGVTSGCSEALLQKYAGNLLGLNDVNITSLKTFASSMVKEGKEEFTQEWIDAGLRKLVFDEDIDAIETIKASKKSAFYGAFLGGVFNSPNMALNRHNIKSINKQIEKGEINESEIITKIKEQYGEEVEGLSNEQIITEYSREIMNLIKTNQIKVETAKENVEKVTDAMEQAANQLEDTIMNKKLEQTIETVIENGIETINFSEQTMDNIESDLSNTQKNINLWKNYDPNAFKYFNDSLQKAPESSPYMFINPTICSLLDEMTKLNNKTIEENAQILEDIYNTAQSTEVAKILRRNELSALQQSNNNVELALKNCSVEQFNAIMDSNFFSDYNRMTPIKISKKEIKNLLGSSEKVEQIMNTLSVYSSYSGQELAQQNIDAKFNICRNDVINTYKRFLSIKNEFDNIETKLTNLEKLNFKKLLESEQEYNQIMKTAIEYYINEMNILNPSEEYQIPELLNKGIQFENLLEKRPIAIQLALKNSKMTGMSEDNLKIFSRLYRFYKETNYPISKKESDNIRIWSNRYLMQLTEKRRMSLKYKNRYGADQDILTGLANSMQTETARERLKNIFQLRTNTSNNKKEQVYSVVRHYFPNISNANLKKYLASVNSAGACSYAAVMNNIYITFADSPQLFKAIFGYDMYNVIDGEKYLNDELLLADFYTYVNLDNEKIINQNHNQKNVYIGNGDNEDQVYLSNSVDGLNKKYLEDFLNYKLKTTASSELQNKAIKVSSSPEDLYPFKIDYRDDTLYSGYRKVEIENLSKKIISSLENGNFLDLGIYVDFENQKNFTMYKYNPSTDNFDIPHDSQFWKNSSLESGLSNAEKRTGHGMAITGIDNDGIYVSSWGEAYYIPFAELNDVKIALSNGKIELVSETE